MSIEKLRSDYERAEARAYKLQEQKEALRDKLRDAVAEAAEKQKAFLDAEALEALRDREDGYDVATTLGLTTDSPEEWDSRRTAG